MGSSYNPLCNVSRAETTGYGGAFPPETGGLVKRQQNLQQKEVHTTYNDGLTRYKRLSSTQMNEMLLAREHGRGER